LLDAVKRFEQIDIMRVASCPSRGLRYHNTQPIQESGKFMSDMQDKITTYTTPLVFYGLANRMDDAHVDGLLAATPTCALQTDL
jgi:oligoendopeptidase F